jgi:hypothetical protein
MNKSIYIFDLVIPKKDNDSGSLDTFNYAQSFLKLGFIVNICYSELLSNQDLIKYSKQNEYCKLFNFNNISDFNSILQNISNSNIEFIMVFRPELLGVIKIIKNKFPYLKIVYNMVDFHYVRMLRKYENEKNNHDLILALNYKESEIEAFNLADAVIGISDNDIKIAKKFVKFEKFYTIGIARDNTSIRIDFNKHETRNKFIFLGGYDHSPNVDAVQHLVSMIWPKFSSINKGYILEIA